jgi:hypothetical protein
MLYHFKRTRHVNMSMIYGAKCRASKMNPRHKEKNDTSFTAEAKLNLEEYLMRVSQDQWLLHLNTQVRNYATLEKLYE